MGHRRISTASTHTLRVSTLWHRLGLHLPRPEVNVGLAHPSWHAGASCGAVRRGRHSWQSGAARLAPDRTRGLLQVSGVRPAESAHSRRDVDRGGFHSVPVQRTQVPGPPPARGVPRGRRGGSQSSSCPAGAGSTQANESPPNPGRFTRRAPVSHAGCVPCAGNAWTGCLSVVAGTWRRCSLKYVDHDTAKRPHRGLGRRAPDTRERAPVVVRSSAPVRRKDVLGGLIHEHELAA